MASTYYKLENPPVHRTRPHRDSSSRVTCRARTRLLCSTHLLNAHDNCKPRCFLFTLQTSCHLTLQPLSRSFSSLVHFRYYKKQESDANLPSLASTVVFARPSSELDTPPSQVTYVCGFLLQIDSNHVSGPRYRSTASRLLRCESVARAKTRSIHAG